MRGTFDNEIRNAITQSKGGGTTNGAKPFGKAAKGKSLGPFKAAPKAGSVDAEDMQDGGIDEAAEGEPALTPKQAMAAKRAGGFHKAPMNTGKVSSNRRAGIR